MVYIYILRCTERQWYVGKTNEAGEAHIIPFQKENQSEWTEKYVPIEVDQVIPGCDETQRGQVHAPNNEQVLASTTSAADGWFRVVLDNLCGTSSPPCPCTGLGSSAANCPKSQAVETSVDPSSWTTLFSLFHPPTRAFSSLSRLHPTVHRPSMQRYPRTRVTSRDPSEKRDGGCKENNFFWFKKKLVKKRI